MINNDKTHETTSKRDVLLLFGLIPEKLRSDIEANSKKNIQYAANSLQYSVIKGLSYYYKRLHVLNFPFVGGFPIFSRSIKIRQANEAISGVEVKSVSYFNIAGLKNYFIYIKAVRLIKKWIKKSNGEKTILIYSAYLPFLKAALRIKRIQASSVSVCLLLPDLVEFMNKPTNLFYKSFVKQSTPVINTALKSIDAFVLITSDMQEKLPLDGKKFVVMEGIFDSDNKEENSVTQLSTLEEKVIFYSGHLDRRYGILNLVNAFMLLRDPQLKLVICGDGNSKNEILAAAKIDNRIQYLGQIPRENVLELQKKSFLLVNPRTAEADYTKYSFPSKTLEYLGSGVPTLMYKLPGIPNIYYDFCFTIMDPSVEALKIKIEEILSMDTTELLKKSASAKKFVIENKNPIAQCYKIFELIEMENKSF